MAPTVRASKISMLRNRCAQSARKSTHLWMKIRVSQPGTFGGKDAEDGSSLREWHKVLNEEVSIRQVAREMGGSRNTVHPYLQESEPVWKKKEARCRPVLKGVAPRIEALLEEWGSRTNKKQRITGVRILRQLREEGYQVARTTVLE